MILYFVLCVTFSLTGGVTSLEQNLKNEEHSKENCTNKNSYCNDSKISAMDGNHLKSSDDPARPSNQAPCETKGGLRVETMTCFSSSGPLNCGEPLPEGALVSFTCPPYYYANKLISMCKRDGNWTVPIKCNSECGRPSPQAVPLIMHGRPASPGQFPWVAAYYLRDPSSGQWSYSCAATLIADNAIITAAHCTWNQKKANMLIALGDTHRDLAEYNHQQIFHVKRVYYLPVYRDSTNYYNSDIAILLLESQAKLSDNILPACLPAHIGNTSVTPFTHGIVAGWGINERKQKSDTLHYMEVPIIDMIRCMKYIPRQFIKFIAFTSFCAGYINGTGACNGDSGAGLLTNTDAGGRFVLQGVVSISPRRGTSKFCHPRNYSLYTKVMLYVDWILKVLTFEDNKMLQQTRNT